MQFLYWKVDDLSKWKDIHAFEQLIQRINAIADKNGYVFLS